MRIATVSLNQAWENKDNNFHACRSFAQKAKSQGVELVIFPEMSLTAFSMNTGDTAEARPTSTTVTLFRQLAQELRIAIIFGVVFQDGDKATNNAVLVDAAGLIRGSYSKIHPFSFAGEDRVFNGGNEICVAKLESINIGLTICYDLRFPEIYSALGKQCTLIINIANWPAQRVDHWNTLLKARAIENQLFMVGVNRTGIDVKGHAYARSSQVINPNGELLSPAWTDEEIDIFDIELTYVDRFRQAFPTARDRKPILYKSIL